MTATLLPVRYRVRAGIVRPLRRRVTIEVEDGSRSTVLQTVSEPGRDPGEREPVLLTILAVRVVDVEQLALLDARPCGYRTATALRDAWRQAHPLSPHARLVQFALGDLRDNPRLLAWTGVGYDYTSTPWKAAITAEPEALTPAELERAALLNGQTFIRRRAELSNALGSQTAAQRMQRIEQASERMRVDIRSELRIIEQRILRAEKRANQRPQGGGE